MKYIHTNFFFNARGSVHRQAKSERAHEKLFVGRCGAIPVHFSTMYSGLAFHPVELRTFHTSWTTITVSVVYKSILGLPVERFTIKLVFGQKLVRNDHQKLRQQKYVALVYSIQTSLPSLLATQYYIQEFILLNMGRLEWQP